MDKPGGRKIHANPKPLGGGVAVFLGFALPVLAGLLWINFGRPPAMAISFDKSQPSLAPAYWSGARDRTPVAVEMLGAALVMHLLGLWDDRKALGPYLKLFVQLAVIAALVVSNNEVRALAFLGRPDRLGSVGVGLSIVISILWIVAVTNAFNFLDNMDGLSAGVAAVCTTAFLVATLSIEQSFVAASLSLAARARCSDFCASISPRPASSWGTAAGRPGDWPAAWHAHAPHDVRASRSPRRDRAGRLLARRSCWRSRVRSDRRHALRLMRRKSPFVGDTNHFVIGWSRAGCRGEQRSCAFTWSMRPRPSPPLFSLVRC